MSLTPREGAAIDVSIERVEYSFTRRGGPRTTYFLAQPFSAEEMSKLAVEKAVARRAVKEGP